MLDAFSRISSGTGDIFQQHIQVRISSILYLQIGEKGEGARKIDELCCLINLI